MRLHGESFLFSSASHLAHPHLQGHPSVTYLMSCCLSLSRFSLTESVHVQILPVRGHFVFWYLCIGFLHAVRGLVLRRGRGCTFKQHLRTKARHQC